MSRPDAPAEAGPAAAPGAAPEAGRDAPAPAGPGPGSAAGAPPEAVPAAAYRRRRDRHAATEAALAARSRGFSAARLVVAGGAVFLVLRILLDAAAPPAWPFVALALAVGLFAVLAVLHGRLLRRQRRLAELVAIQDEGLARLDRRWDDLPPSPLPPPELRGPHGDLPPVARDLGLFGPVSVGRLLSTARTPAGRRTLARWLLEPAPPAELRRRQPAVRELAAEPELRQELELAGRQRRRSANTGRRPGGDEEDAPRLESFLAWAEGEPWLLRRPLLLWIARISPLVVLALTVAAVAGLVPGSLAALVLVANLALSWGLAGPLDERFSRVSAGPEELATYAAALEALEGHPFRSPKLAGLAAELAAAEGEGPSLPAARWMARLARRVEIADARHGSFHVFTQVLTLWDFHALALLERWQQAAGPRVRGWLAALGELEALAALATLAHDHPGWTFPEVRDGAPEAGTEEEAAAPVLEGRGLGHPLLPDGQRVGNDVTVGPPGTFLLVTGSNMSGKSTLLRALGTNATLAQAGGPVCAAALSLPPLRLGTSILVEDSLADGVSFFYAELLRLKQVVDLADRTRDEGRTLLYLLDEVLRGTNSRERREAVVRVLHHLLEAGAIGAISTHDLELGAVPEIAAAAVPVHFRETVHHPGEAPAGEEAPAAPPAVPEGAPRPAMTFDYRLRPGLSTTTNALALLAAVGLDDPPPAAPPPDPDGSQRLR